MSVCSVKTVKFCHSLTIKYFPQSTISNKEAQILKKFLTFKPQQHFLRHFITSSSCWHRCSQLVCVIIVLLLRRVFILLIAHFFLFYFFCLFYFSTLSSTFFTRTISSSLQKVFLLHVRTLMVLRVCMHDFWRCFFSRLKERKSIIYSSSLSSKTCKIIWDKTMPKGSW